MNSTQIDFGRYKGKTAPQLVFVDPDYFFWGIDNGLFTNANSKLREEAYDVADKAQRIRIQRLTYLRTSKFVAVYILCSMVGFFKDMQIVPQVVYDDSNSFICDGNSFIRDDNSLYIALDVINLSIPYQNAYYGRTGARFLVYAVKQYLFGDRYYRMTAKRAAAFFEDDDNFLVLH